MEIENRIKKELEQIKLWDYTKLLKLARSYSRMEISEHRNAKIAFLGSYSIQFIVSVTKLLLCNYGIYPDIYEGEFNGIQMDVLNVESDFYKFSPDYIIILPDYRDIKAFPAMLDSQESVECAVCTAVDSYVEYWDKIQNYLPGSQILMSNFIEPYEQPLGNLECNYNFSRSSFFKRINRRLIDIKPHYVKLLDMEALSSYIGKRSWFDETNYFLYKYTFSLKYIGVYCDLIVRQIAALKGKIRKCLILDLDNTLWGGTVGDEGYDGILLDPNDAEGEAYRAFQHYVSLLKQRGVILAVCSKNDYENAREPFFENPNMILKYDDFSCFVANWEDKVSNIQLIAKQLNLGLDSMVFFDDNPTERELVKTYLPEVYTIEVPEDPASYMKALDRAAAFDWIQLTREDIDRTGTYAENRKREALRMDYRDYNEYLKALNTEGKFEALQKKQIERFTQLLNKSNQFNLRTQRYTLAQIYEMHKKEEYGLFSVSLKDKFSNYGMIACVILRFQPDFCFIESWVMSCRILKREVEKFTFSKILEIANTRGYKKILGEYIPTAKNKIVCRLYEEFGFQPIKSVAETEDKRLLYEFSNDMPLIHYNIKEMEK